jgi:drug/metabolite transporter (DMT)-like permease
VPAVAFPLESPGVLPHLLVAGIIGAGIPSFLFLSSIRLIGGVRTGILMLFEPVVGVLLAAAVLGEAVSPVQGLGGALVLVAAFILQRSATRASSDDVAGPLTRSDDGSLPATGTL